MQESVDAQARVDAAYVDKAAWIKKCISVTVNMGKYSSDRTITEYAEQIWNIRPHPLPQISAEEGAQAPAQMQVGSLRRHNQGSFSQAVVPPAPQLADEESQTLPRVTHALQLLHHSLSQRIQRDKD